MLSIKTYCWAESPAGLEILRAIRKQSVASHLQEKRSVLFMLLFTRNGQDPWTALCFVLFKVDDEKIH